MRRMFALWLILGAIAAPPALAQTTPIDKLRAMGGDLDELDGKSRDKDKLKPPFEFYKSQIAPFDILPFVKRNHWSTLLVEMQANLDAYDGLLQTATDVGGRPQIPLLDMPHAMVFRREAHLRKEDRRRLALNLFLPNFRKELLIELTRPDSIRPDFSFTPTLQRLETHQMLIPILCPDPNPYASWNRMQATIPTSGDRESGTMEVDKQRYYRLVLPQTEKPALSSNPLTWTTTSHIVWDNLSPQDLTPDQRGAMLDWLHWGGQLIVVAAGPTFGLLGESFLNDYLPATATGQKVPLKEPELAALSRAYPPPLFPTEYDSTLEVAGIKRTNTNLPPRYKPFDAIQPQTDRPLYLTGLLPKPGATVLPLGDPGNHPIAVEWRVGRGRVLMLAVNPNDPALAKWTGMDTFVRRVLLRRVEEPQAVVSNTQNRVYQFLSGPELTSVRFLGRDLGARAVPENDDNAEPNSPLRPEPVGAWLDTYSTLPVMARDSLERASGITIPGSRFVLKVILAYVIMLVPVNWLICRFVLRRREWAWIAVPLLALGTAIAVERAAAYDMGFDSDCTEIDILELQGNYARGHLNRFAAIYSTGRDRFTLTTPNNPTALTLPLNNRRSLRGEETAYSTFQTVPDPALADFQVQPRSLAMFRGEAMVDLPGSMTLNGDLDKGTFANGTGMELRGAILLDADSRRTRWLGTVSPGGSVPLADLKEPWRDQPEPIRLHDDKSPQPDIYPATSAVAREIGWTDPAPYLNELLRYSFNRPEDRGEVRLLAWTPDPHPGQTITPDVDRHRGFRLVVAHLRYGPPPDPGRQEFTTNTPVAPLSPQPLDAEAGQR